MIVTTLSKVAARKFLTEEGLACEIEDDLWYNVEILNCAATLRKTAVGEGGGERDERKQAARWYKNLCWSKNSEKSLIGEIRREFRLVMSVGQRKNSESPWGIEPQTVGFRAPMLYHWATETLRWTRSITKFIWQASCILLGSAKSWIICKCNISITEFYLDHFHRKSHLIFNKKKTFRQT